MSSLEQRARRLGIEADYVDAHGKKQVVKPDALERVVDAVSGGRPADATDGLPKVVVVRPSRAFALDIDPELAPSGAAWRLNKDDEVVARGALDGTTLRLPRDLPLGHYRLALNGADDGTLETAVLVAPDRAFEPQMMQEGGRVWVLAFQLYGVRSGRNWGHGDFTDLAGLLELSAAVGAAGIALNPLHALFDDRPEQSSPYGPNSRCFLNILYIDVEAIPEFPGLEEAGLAEEVAALRARDTIDYTGVAAAKLKGLRLAYERFCEKPSRARQRDFKAFREERGPLLARFAAFETLRRKFNTVWWEWPEPWRKPDDAKIEGLRRKERADFVFYEFVQWIADRQLGQCRDLAERLKLPIGLYLDVAVGAEPGGADCWMEQDAYLQGISVGAPPDLLNTAGQDWGVAAFNPAALPAQNFRPFREMLRASMRYAGAIRIDHVIGLNRIYLVPFGLGPQNGAYLRFPFEAMLAVVAQESHAHGTLVVGEDLGTVPEDLRDMLADWGIWSYLVMLFERHHGSGSFRHPHEYNPNALVSFTTHDLPTFSGWRSGHDLDVKRGIGLDPGETDEERERAHAYMRQVLDECQLGPTDTIQFEAVTRFLARTRSKLLVVSIEDAIGVADQPNIPGTVDEHPNWRRVLPVALEDLAQDPRLRALGRLMAEEGRASAEIAAE